MSVSGGIYKMPETVGKAIACTLIVGLKLIANPTRAANGNVAYTYDALGRPLSASYDTNVLLYYTYDANGNRTSEGINVNTQKICLDSSAHSNPTAWGTGLWATAASGC